MKDKRQKLPINQIILGDCITLLKEIPDECIDLVISSPPYNLGKEYEARQALDIYLESQKNVLQECSRVLKKTGSLFWQVGAFADKGTIIPLDIRLFPILESCGLLPRNRIIWARQHGLHAQKKFSCRHETILWFTKSNEYIFNLDAIRVPQKYQNKKHYRGNRKGELSCNPDGKNPGDIWLFRNVKHNHEEQTIHPCQFPEDLVSRIVLATTNAGDLVFDPYMGAGTVAVVSKNHNRNFIGTEIDPKYHQVGLRRLSGEPDEKGYFPNLKTLRDYVERTGQPIEKFRFDVQIGEKASDRSKAKIYPEEYHLQEMYERLLYEEAAFSATLQGEDIPIDPKLNGNGKKTAEKIQKSQQIELELF
ncbi:site-specific DNA-methyltransferase [Nostoc sp. FACHB-87]|uniref:DNA-methyltransferase n=1 Tax=Nostocales TaxID=1161 RepID=UPI001682EBBB|nr:MULTISPECIES: site-specific DNA-methyltransferase [Nostocales]MBD2300733.1 site-specific DNA-methyltransferase [Nostoc sp. FACHB-190]MBD2458508.1 site-specific DNA-methyltransferase [Nostoc sp. FACHB-87]MBD2478658.1 site-specific DNA-methyltransferase [Anabaena sp. FACHB-83]MBD2489145.1 site-specific DNA-methyltransferase [Aulosira sp. FACHB-615]